MGIFMFGAAIRGKTSDRFKVQQDHKVNKVRKVRKVNKDR